MSAPAKGQQNLRGIEMRVHGIGDHEIFSALGRPEYKETADDRVWIGSLPRVPKHELKLINWSRASRKISRTLSWYFAYPFTLLNVAGYMGPEISEARGEKVLWRCMRGAIVISSVTITLAMAAWITVILETVWRILDAKEDRFSNVILCGLAPCLLIILIVNRMIRGKALADKGNSWVSILTIGALLGAIVFLASKPASDEAWFTPFGDASARDPMTEIVTVTTAIVWLFALILCAFAWWAGPQADSDLARAQRRLWLTTLLRGNGAPAKIGRRLASRTRIDRTALAGAGILMALSIAILHTAGSILRLVTQTIVQFTPQAIQQRANEAVQRVADISGAVQAGASEAARATGRAITGRAIEQVTSAPAVLLPIPDDLGQQPDTPGSTLGKIGNVPKFTGAASEYFDHALRIDLVPVFFIAMVIVFGLLLFREYWRRTPPPYAGSQDDLDPLDRKAKAAVHTLIEDLPKFLARVGTLAIVITVVVWAVLAAVFKLVSAWVPVILIALQIAGIVLFVLLIVRRPEKLADQLRQVFGSVADIAGFWAPDLHPLAGASYRRAVIRGIREGVRDIRDDHPGTPIALVGHSQGSVVCAWFVRGGYWKERRSESLSDEQALKMGLHRLRREQSDLIALFTCGSPLQSLYRTFFPRYFSNEFFKTAQNMAFANIWSNYWRKTDPIGTRLRFAKTVRDRGTPQIRNLDVTELVSEQTKGHGEYWQDARLRNDVERFFAFFVRFHTLRGACSANGVPITGTTLKMNGPHKGTASFTVADEPMPYQVSYENGAWDGWPTSEELATPSDGEPMGMAAGNGHVDGEEPRTLEPLAP